MEHFVREVLIECLSKAGVDQGDHPPLHAFLVGLQLLQQADSRLDNNNNKLVDLEASHESFQTTIMMKARNELEVKIVLAWTV